MNVNQVEIPHIVLIKLPSEEWLVKLIFAKWLRLTNKIYFLIGKGLNRINKHNFKMISK